MTIGTQWLTAVIAIGIGASPAIAQEAAGPRVLGDIAACRAIPTAAERLACFDKAAGALVTAVEKKDVRLVDRAEVRRARRSLFGFTLPQIELFGGKRGDATDDRDAFTEINTTVASATPAENGRVRIVLAAENGEDTGAVWTTTDPMNFPPKPGAKIRIRKGALGNYFLNVDGRSYRGMRVR